MWIVTNIQVSVMVFQNYRRYFKCDKTVGRIAQAFWAKFLIYFLRVFLGESRKPERQPKVVRKSWTFDFRSWKVGSQ